ncbi:hypothetical protein C7M61_000828 [Candidozyma pseudohaemuli]|uniref:Zn(2)-C6 fungal-type domain-containing protein n=1 Tax=Candidozyma pseudohaemuli TaxID=418784 RepID=A0A2P7YYW3_9ASCO|nr:hypothetical protein C7M61_000828 [[Candida] pseudohaemulonii]PSK41155.1 hypothetical protein C7M61_000828 [[Candida] pseudohaemulonii]
MPQRRLRHSSVCTFCKRRKTKCDKGNPCSTCIKYNNPHCEYDGPPPVKRSSETYAETIMNGFYKNNRPGLQQTRSASNNHNLLDELLYFSEAPANAPADVHTELEMLKRKISILENSVKLSKTSDSSQIWSGGLNDLSYLVGYHPYASETEEFSFHDRYVPFFNHCVGLPRHYGPLSWIALIKIDNAINGMLAYQHRNVQMKRQFLKEQEQGEMQPSDKLFKEKIFKSDAFNDMSLKDSLRSTPEDRLRIRLKINDRAKAVGLTYYEGGIDSSLQLLDKIELILPTRKVIWLLLDRFFDRVVLFFPFVDEFDFLEHMERILGPRSYTHEKIEKVNVDKKTDFPQLGMLLIFLRFAYLTLFSNIETENDAKFNSNCPTPEAQTEKYLMHNPIDIDILEIAESCLHQFSFLRYCTLPILQLALYIKLYYMYSPENGEVPEDSHSQSFTALLINMAISLGMHRDPDHFDQPVRDERTNNLCRKIWNYLIVFDLNGAIANGTPICISKGLFDTKPPYHKPGNENLRNMESELAVIEAFSRVELAYEPLINTVQAIVNVQPIPMSQLTNRLNDMEVDFIKDLTNVSLNLNLECSLAERRANAMRTKIYFQANFFFLGVNFHFFNYYESKNNFDLAYFYLKKVIVVAVYNMMPFYENYVEKSSSYFEGTTDLAITPGFQSLVHKCLIVILSIMARARFSVLFFESLPTHNSSLMTDPDYKLRYELIQTTYNLAFKCLRVITDTLTKLSSRYYYSWRCVKAQNALRQTFNGTDFYLNWCKGKECYSKFSNDMLEDLNKILQGSLDRVTTTKDQDMEPSVEQLEPQVMSGSTVNSDYSAQTAPDAIPSSNGFVTRNPSVGPEDNMNMPYQSQEIDNLWMQMMTEKPQRSSRNLFGRTPPSMDIDYGLGTFDHLIFENWETTNDPMEMNGDNGPESMNFLDSQNLEEIIRLVP